MDASVKQEIMEMTSGAAESSRKRPAETANGHVSVIQLSSSSESDSDDDSDEEEEDENDAVSGSSKKRKMDALGVVLPPGFLQPLSPVRTPVAEAALACRSSEPSLRVSASASTQSCKQFWKAGDYEGAPCGAWDSSSIGIDHVRVHPKFLHSNATSHKWALGAFAELLDNSLDEVCYGATYVSVDMLVNEKDGGRMLLIEDDGGGMDPDKMRHCMSLGYSAKSKVANAIGQYGNGFKTSTMRLGADVIVFSHCRGKDGKSPTRSIGLLSYTFLRSTGKEDIVVPMLDYEKGGQEWNKMVRSSPGDWSKNAETIVQWSPFSSEADLLRQFNLMRNHDHGTRIIIYNLWEDDQGMLELDFDVDPKDIQIRGVNRDDKNIQMAKEYPNSRHFLTYRHSLRSYVSILYLRLPPHFRIILRGEDVGHHNIVNDMMLSQQITYRPQPGADGVPKDSNMVVVVTVGFVKDAKHHIDVQGFNVYHKNRLIKPFWRIWNAAGSDGRGVIGVLEANFVEPAHDKQGFERTTVLARLESRLIQMQKNYWSSNCHRIGYAPRRNKKSINDSAERETSPDFLSQTSQSRKKFDISSSKTSFSVLEKYSSRFHGSANGQLSSKGKSSSKTPTKSGIRQNSSEPSSSSADDVSDDGMHIAKQAKQANGSGHKTFHAVKAFGKDGIHMARSSSYLENIESQQDYASGGRSVHPSARSMSKGGDADIRTLEQLKEENRELRKRLEKKEGEALDELLHDLEYERGKCKSVETQLQLARKKIEVMNVEHESLLDMFSEERERRENEERNLKKKLQDANNTIQGLRDRLRQLENN